MPAAYPFLSDEWIAAAREIRARHATDDVEVPGEPIRMNQVITDVPFGEGTIHSYLDTSSGALVLELGELDEPDLTVTTDWETAKTVFVDQDIAAATQAFLQGRIKVQGNMMKLMTMQTSISGSPAAVEAARELQAITA
jgi:putative sterol carrier protein